ncbi:MAG: HypC/HybG/HupF family hydrogenase formation chaperone [Candidatus Omnitrophica bacterium]|nr:HypC/HybG/HupF family hydrogenase formation chaperone [Candidatus Omnitrophota bacterium]
MCLAYPMKIVSIEGNSAIAEANGVKRDINIQLVDNVNLGDYVMVHVGFAIQKIDKKEAEETLKLFREYNDILSKNLRKKKLSKDLGG